MVVQKKKDARDHPDAAVLSREIRGQLRGRTGSCRGPSIVCATNPVVPEAYPTCSLDDANDGSWIVAVVVEESCCVVNPTVVRIHKARQSCCYDSRGGACLVSRCVSGEEKMVGIYYSKKKRRHPSYSPVWIFWAEWLVWVWEMFLLLFPKKEWLLDDETNRDVPVVPEQKYPLQN